MRNPIETSIKSSLFIYAGYVFWRIKQDPNEAINPSGLMIVLLGACASGFLVWGLIIIIANIKIGMERGNVERKVQEKIDLIFNPQKESVERRS